MFSNVLNCSSNSYSCLLFALTCVYEMEKLHNNMSAQYNERTIMNYKRPSVPPLDFLLNAFDKK